MQGRIEFDARVVDDGATTWLIVEAAEAAPLAEWLNKMKFMLRVEIADVSADWAVLGSTRRVPEWSAAAGLGRPLAARRCRRLLLRRGGRGLPPRAGTALVRIPGPGRGARGRRWATAPLAGVWAAEALRIAAWRPRWGAETDDKTIPHELDLLRTAVHLAKGCYKGQETIARVHNLGHPPRRLVFLQLDGSQHTMPAVGSEVRAGDRKVGTVTSVAQHYEMGPVALAVIKRSVAPDASPDGPGRRRAVHRGAGSHRGSRRRAGRGPPDRIPEGDPLNMRLNTTCTGNAAPAARRAGGRPDDETLALAHALFDAAREGNSELLGSHLAAGAPANLTNAAGDSLLMLAAYHGHPDTVRLILQHGGDANAANDRGQTPLAGAVFKGYTEVARELLDAGADPDAGTPSARDAARMFARADILALLG